MDEVSWKFVEEEIGAELWKLLEDWKLLEEGAGTTEEEENEDEDDEEPEDPEIGNELMRLLVEFFENLCLLFPM